MQRSKRSRRLLGAAAATAAVSLGLVITTATIASRGADSEPPTVEQVAALTAKALEVAKANGEPSPREIRMVVTTRNAAVELTGGSVSSEDRSVAITMLGEFVADGPRPYGAPGARGNALTLVFDASTLELSDLALTHTEPDLTRLGQVVPVRS